MFFKQLFSLSLLDKSMDDDQTSNIDAHSDSLLGVPPNLFGSSIDANKRPNPFRTSAQDVLHQLQQPQMMLHPNISLRGASSRPMLDIPTGFNNNNARPFLHHNPLTPEIDPNQSNQSLNPFLLNNPRNLTPHQTHSPQMNYRNNNNPSVRGNSPYFRNQKTQMRGNYRPNFRGGNMRGNW